MARPRKLAKDRVTTAVRFPRELHEALQETAEEAEVSMNYVVNVACRNYLKSLGDRWEAGSIRQEEA